MADEIARLSEELARDPGSPVFLQLGEALRRRGQLDLALKVAVRGLERHPHNPEAHDLLARIAVDRGDLERAFDEWDMTARLAPGHAGARKGMGFICFRQGRLAEAERYLAEAAAMDGEDTSIASALSHVRQRLQNGNGDPPLSTGEMPAFAPRRHTPPPPPSAAAGPAVESSPAGVFPGGTNGDPRALFADVFGEGAQTGLLLDATGLVLAGTYMTADGEDVAQEVGAELSGVSDEARRAMRHLGLGDWTSITFETEVAIVAMAPAPGDGLLMVASARETPLGLVRRLLDRAGERARAWMDAKGVGR